MDVIEIRNEITIAAPIEGVWPYIGTGDGLSRWLDADVTLEAYPGGRYEERKRTGSPRRVLRGSVIAIHPPRELTLSCRLETTPGKTWPVFTDVTFALAATGAGTRVTIVHSGFENLPPAYRDETWHAFSQVWAADIAHLADGQR